MPSDITELSVSSLSAAIRSRSVTCVEVMAAYLAQINRYNGVYNAIVSMLDGETLMGQAAAADRELDAGKCRGWMHGMPHAVKDLANARGLETSSGSPLVAGTVAEADDLFVSRIRSTGAIFVGKTNVPEFGFGSQTFNSVFGATRNAYDPTLTSGGSSGGAAVGLATHMLPCADGSDLMGSLRNPAGFNNVVGYRPSQGRVPRLPTTDAFYQQLATAGAMGRNVEDTIRLLGTISGYDARAPLSLRDVMPEYEAFRAKDLGVFRIGWMGDYGGYLATESGVTEVCERSLRDLAKHGVAVENCQPAYDLGRLWEAWLIFRHWSSLWLKDFYDDLAKRRLLKPEVVWEFDGGLSISGQQLFNAGIARSEWYDALHALLQQYDVLALPSAQVFPFSVETQWPKTINGRKMDTYHRWMEVVIGGTLSGLPVVNLPAGFDERGRPMGMQFIGRMGEDQGLLEFAMAYEAATDFPSRRPVLRQSL